jgi:hypothetical protein
MTIHTNSSVTRTSGNIATILFIVVIFFQLLIATGLLPITMAWGGRQTELTIRFRIAGIVSAVILGLFVYIIRRRAGLLETKRITAVIKVFAWIVTAFMALNTFGNLTSQSTAEKMIFTPITAMLAVVCFVVSISRQEM